MVAIVSCIIVWLAFAAVGVNAIAALFGDAGWIGVGGYGLHVFSLVIGLFIGYIL